MRRGVKTTSAVALDLIGEGGIGCHFVSDSCGQLMRILTFLFVDIE